MNRDRPSKRTVVLFCKTFGRDGKRNVLPPRRPTCRANENGARCIGTVPREGCVCSAAQSLNGTTSWRCSPRPSMPRVITSPFFRYSGGFMPMPTPGGVPVVITSPGISVMNWLT